MLSERLAELILQTTETLPAPSVARLIARLEDLDGRALREQIPDEILFQSLIKISEKFPDPVARYEIDKLFDAWREDKQLSPKLTLRELASTLEILVFSRTKDKNRQKIELVWTGPASRIPVRQTRQVLSQLINNAQQELLIVSFVVFKIPEIITLLRNALMRGVAITCILESPEESDGKITFQGFPSFDDEALKQIEILVWDKEMRPPNAAGKSGTLHAKVAVADRQVSFISSANLTVNAMTLNMELGLLLYNKTTAQEIVEHFRQLKQNKMLVRKSLES